MVEQDSLAVAESADAHTPQAFLPILRVTALTGHVFPKLRNRLKQNPCAGSTKCWLANLMSQKRWPSKHPALSMISQYSLMNSICTRLGRATTLLQHRASSSCSSLLRSCLILCIIKPPKHGGLLEIRTSSVQARYHGTTEGATQSEMCQQAMQAMYMMEGALPPNVGMLLATIARTEQQPCMTRAASVSACFMWHASSGSTVNHLMLVHNDVIHHCMIDSSNSGATLVFLFTPCSCTT